jgi:phosphoribosylformylglycinamidine cyclo-ligase
MYARDDYDLAGFCVGIVEQSAIIDGSKIRAGDQVIGIASSGPHSNGYSLIRKVLAQSDLTAASPWENSTLGAHLLAPTRIYVRAILNLIAATDVHGIAHITGGGLPENLARVLPASVDARIDTSAWQRPPIFGWLQKEGNIAEAELLRTFNCGIGMTVVVPAQVAGEALDVLAASGEKAMLIGEIVAGNGRVRTG